jgi:hypothetical protein
MTIALVGTAGTPVLGAYQGAISPPWGSGESRTAGNLLICWHTGFEQITYPTTPAGWSIAAHAQLSGGGNVSLFYKVAAGGDAAPTFGSLGSQTQAAGLSEFSGLSSTPLDQSGAARTTTSPIVKTLDSADVASGELVIAIGCLYYPASASLISSHTFNNGVSPTYIHNDATSTQCHYRFAYGLTTGNSVADSDSYRDSYDVVTSIGLALASFKAASSAPTLKVRRSSAWTAGAVKVRRSSAWTAPTAVKVRRGGAWTTVT